MVDLILVFFLFAICLPADLHCRLALVLLFFWALTEPICFVQAGVARFWELPEAFLPDFGPEFSWVFQPEF